MIMTDFNTNLDPTNGVGLGDATKVLEAEIAEQKDRYLRLAADFDNYRHGDAVFRPAKVVVNDLSRSETSGHAR
jgi:molecular chaperone GrpE (heat shock protein)